MEMMELRRQPKLAVIVLLFALCGCDRSRTPAEGEVEAADSVVVDSLRISAALQQQAGSIDITVEYRNLRSTDVAFDLGAGCDALLTAYAETSSGLAPVWDERERVKCSHVAVPVLLRPRESYQFTRSIRRGEMDFRGRVLSPGRYRIRIWIDSHRVEIDLGEVTID